MNTTVQSSHDTEVENIKEIHSLNSLTLTEVFADKKLMHQFRNFTMKEFSSENLYFLEKVIEFEQATQNDKKNLLEEIYEVFLEEDAIMEIEIDKTLITQIEKFLETSQSKIDSDTMKPIKDYVTQMITDTFLRFKGSKEYQVYRESIFLGRTNQRTLKIPKALSKMFSKAKPKIKRMVSLETLVVVRRDLN
eukprot:gene6511-10519_t